MKYLILVLLVLHTSLVCAQYDKNFIPSIPDDTIPQEIYLALKNRLTQDKLKITEKGKAGNYVKSLYDQRFSYLVSTFNADYMMVEHPLTEFLRGVTNRISEANPGMGNDVHIYGYRSNIPNAVSFGEGTICVMLGLLERLETEDQIAFVLCHELAHYYANHTEKNIAKLADLNYDKELKGKINSIMSSPYERYTKLKDLFASLDMSVSKHSRGFEFDADSLGLQFYLNTKYNPYAPLRVMQILEHVDEPVYDKPLDVKKFFNFKEFPFKDSWSVYRKPDLYNSYTATIKADTLRTHPNCYKRFVRLQNQLGLIAPDSLMLRSGIPIKAVNQLAALESVNSDFHRKAYGKSLYGALQLTEVLPQNVYLHAIIVKSLYQLYRAQKNHTLHKVLELPDPGYSDSYNMFLSFVNQLRLHELANISYQYATTRPERFYTEEEFIHALWLCSHLEFSKVDPGKIEEEYESLFPNGKYLKEIKSNYK